MALNKSYILPYGDKGLNVFDQQWNVINYKDIEVTVLLYGKTELKKNCHLKFPSTLHT